MDKTNPELADLIDRSSLGTPTARGLRALADPEDIASVFEKLGYKQPASRRTGDTSGENCAANPHTAVPAEVDVDETVANIDANVVLHKAAAIAESSTWRTGRGKSTVWLASALRLLHWLTRDETYAVGSCRHRRIVDVAAALVDTCVADADTWTCWDAKLHVARHMADVFTEGTADAANFERLLARLVAEGPTEAPGTGMRPRETTLNSVLYVFGDMTVLIGQRPSEKQAILEALRGVLVDDAPTPSVDVLMRIKGDEVVCQLKANHTAAYRLAELLAKRGDTEELRALAEAGDHTATRRLAELLAVSDVYELRVLAATGDHAATRRVVKLLVERGDTERLRALAEAGDHRAAHRLADHLNELGDTDGLRALADAGNPIASLNVARLLFVRGDVDELRALAAAGNHTAAHQLPGLLADRGDIDELRRRADAGDLSAADELVRLLVRRGDEAGLDQEVNAGTEGALKALRRSTE